MSLTSDECKARAESAETLVKEGKTKFKGEVRTFTYDNITVKAFIEDGVIVQMFVYPFDLVTLSVMEKIKQSKVFSDCVRGHYWIQKFALPIMQKVYGGYLKVEQEAGAFVLLDIDLRRWWQLQHGL